MTTSGLDTQQQELFEQLKTLSYKRGQFTLSSGRTSSYYMDGRLTTLSAEGSRLIGEILYEIIAPLGVNAVGGMTMGADPIVTAITVTSAQKGNSLNGFLIRKEPKGHGTQRQVEGHLKPGDKVVLLEDVITTGGSFVKAIEAIRNFSPDIEIVRLLALVDREEGAQERLKVYGIPLQALFQIHAFHSEYV